MKSNPYDPVSTYSVSKLTVSLLLASALGVVLPHGVQAQNVPPVSRASLTCPGCNTHVSSASSGCPNPNCKYYRGQKPLPRKIPKGPTPPLPPKHPLHPPKSANNGLYYDFPVPPAVTPPANDPNLLGDALAKIKDLDRKKQEEEAQNLEKRKSSLLKGVEPQKLNNPFAGDTSVVDLSGTKKLAIIPPQQSKQEPNEYTFMQQVKDESRYAQMSSSDLRWLASQYPNNAEIQAQAKIMEKLADERDTLQFKHLVVRSVDDRANEHLKKRDKAMDSMAENAADQVIPGFGGIALKTAMSEDSAAEKRKEWISFAAEKMKDDIIESSDIYTKAAEIFTEKIGESLTKKLLIVPTVYEFSRDAAKAGYYQYQYNEQHKILDPTGGPSKTMGDWERVNSQILDESAKLHTLITRENKASSSNP